MITTHRKGLVDQIESLPPFPAVATRLVSACESERLSAEQIGRIISEDPALAARIGSMKTNQEIDALHVMGINPVRFLVAPALIACLIMVPALTFFSHVSGLLAAGLYVNLELKISLAAYFDQVVDALSAGDLLHGLSKSLIFAVLIAVIGVVNGASVTGGAEGVGKATTRAVVQSISAIIVTDMLFVFAVTR